jgi:hypothetical protein
MKLLVDMNLSPQWVPYFAERGFEAVHWSTLGPAGAQDDVIFDYARAGGFIIFTHDLVLPQFSRCNVLMGQALFRPACRTCHPIPSAPMFWRPCASSHPNWMEVQS